MFALPPPRRNDDDAARSLIKAMLRVGFVECRGQQWLLTEKGWRTLAAAIEVPIVPVTQSKAAIEGELRQWAHDVVSVGAFGAWRGH